MRSMGAVMVFATAPDRPPNTKSAENLARDASLPPPILLASRSPPLTLRGQ